MEPSLGTHRPAGLHIQDRVTFRTLSRYPPRSSLASSMAAAGVAPIRCRRRARSQQSLSSLATQKTLGGAPRPGFLVCRGDSALPASDNAARLLSGLCQGGGGRGAGVPGSPPEAPGPASLPPDAACCSGRGRSPVSVTLSSARENSMLAPSRRPHPAPSHSPLPSWQGDGKRQLISSPRGVCGRVLNSPRLITEHLIPALLRGGCGDAWKFLFTPFCTGLHANRKQTGVQPPLPLLPPHLRMAPLTRAPFPLSSLVPSRPLLCSGSDLRALSSGLACSRAPSPLCTSHFS